MRVGTGFTTTLAGSCFGNSLIASTGSTGGDITFVLTLDPTIQFTR